MVKDNPVFILIIDDDDVDANWVERMLNQSFDGSFHIERARQFKEAEDLLKKKKIDVVILDLWLPDACGLETVSDFYDQFPELPFIVFSGNEDPLSFWKSIELGAHDYLIKGQISAEAFCRCVRSAMIRKKFELKLVQLSENKSLFLAQMSHEIRTPLHVLLSMLDLLKEDPHLQPTQFNAVRVMSAAGDALYDLVNDILDLSKVEAGKLELESAVFNLHFFVQNIFEVFKLKARAKNIDFQLKIDPQVPSQVQGDSSRIRQVLVNLIGNAIKFTDHGGVVLSVENVQSSSKNEILFKVSDTGPGINPVVIPKLFNAYEQGELIPSAGKGGTGLGLFISKKLIEKMGGTMNLNSCQIPCKKGSEFFFQIPLKSVFSDPRKTAKTSEEDLQNLLIQLGSASILIADDAAEAPILYQAFFRRSSVAFDLVENGRIALEKYQSKDYDLVLLDYQMPEIDGFQVALKIREYEQAKGLKKCKILALTGDTQEETQKKAQEMGFDGFLVKPVRLYHFLKTLVTLLKEP